MNKNEKQISRAALTVAGASLVLGAVGVNNAEASANMGFTHLGAASGLRSQLVNHSAQAVDSIYLGSHEKGAEGKCGEGKCGDKKEKCSCGDKDCHDRSCDSKSGHEGKCGEGKCGDKKDSH